MVQKCEIALTSLFSTSSKSENKTRHEDNENNNNSNDNANHLIIEVNWKFLKIFSFKSRSVSSSNPLFCRADGTNNLNKLHNYQKILRSFELR
jgi:hypothetical protein